MQRPTYTAMLSFCSMKPPNFSLPLQDGCQSIIGSLLSPETRQFPWKFADTPVILLVSGGRHCSDPHSKIEMSGLVIKPQFLDGELRA